MEKNEIKQEIKKLLENQRLGVLSTISDNKPYPNLVAFVAPEDLKYIIFATLKDTQKYKNIINNPEISILIDNRENKSLNFNEILIVTAFGKAEIMENDDFKKIYLEKHPYLSDFLKTSGCSLIKMEVEKYQFISHFQDVVVIEAE